MLSKIFFVPLEENEPSIKAMFFDGSFFFFSKKEFCKQFNTHLLIRSQRPKPTSICKKDQN